MSRPGWTAPLPSENITGISVDDMVMLECGFYAGQHKILQIGLMTFRLVCTGYEPSRCIGLSHSSMLTNCTSMLKPSTLRVGGGGDAKILGSGISSLTQLFSFTWKSYSLLDPLKNDSCSRHRSDGAQRLSLMFRRIRNLLKSIGPQLLSLMFRRIRNLLSSLN